MRRNATKLNALRSTRLLGGEMEMKGDEMEIYIFMLFIWAIGWLFTCGKHKSNKDAIKDRGVASHKEEIDFGGLFQYVIIFFAWPYYLGL